MISIKDENKLKILLINPPIYDFAAYDYWLKPLGMLSIAGQLRGKADFRFFDFLQNDNQEKNEFGTGKLSSVKIPKPSALKNIPRYYRRYGIEKQSFVNFLLQNRGFDFVMIQAVMTYWYLGYKEVIETVREIQPLAKIILGGPYAIICSEHAKSIGPDFVADKIECDSVFEYIGIEPDKKQFPLWDIYDDKSCAAMRITTGCPFKCSYCTVPQMYGKFNAMPLQQKIAEVAWLAGLGFKNVAFYDDSLLYKSDEVFAPFLEAIIAKNLNLNFHSPNALNARFITKPVAEIMVKAGFKTFCLGFESSEKDFQDKTGGKVTSSELTNAVKCLITAGAKKKNIIAYQMLGHPKSDPQQAKASMEFIGEVGIKIMLADFSPIPGTEDGEFCREIVNLDEPLMQNKTAFPIISWGNNNINRLKNIGKAINKKINNN